MATNFPELWDRLESNVPERPLEPALKPLVGDVYEAIITHPYDAARVVAALEPLLVYLTTPEGRTSPNCIAVDHFFCFGEDWQESWEEEPEELAGILWDMGAALHDAVAAPERAESFDSTPEQLLGRVRDFRRRLG